tara:strand:- start:591 stop:758 length:168 start_codon:yes stop_codon:yes gene_type:complete
MKRKIKHEHIFCTLFLFCASLIIILDNYFIELFWLFCYSIWLLLYFEKKKDKFFE